MCSSCCFNVGVVDAIIVVVVVDVVFVTLIVVFVVVVVVVVCGSSGGGDLVFVDAMYENYACVTYNYLFTCLFILTLMFKKRV